MEEIYECQIVEADGKAFHHRLPLDMGILIPFGIGSNVARRLTVAACFRSCVLTKGFSLIDLMGPAATARPDPYRLKHGRDPLYAP